jgi:hypothetical protein
MALGFEARPRSSGRSSILNPEAATNGLWNSFEPPEQALQLKDG